MVLESIGMLVLGEVISNFVHLKCKYYCNSQYIKNENKNTHMEVSDGEITQVAQ